MEAMFDLVVQVDQVDGVNFGDNREALKSCCLDSRDWRAYAEKAKKRESGYILRRGKSLVMARQQERMEKVRLGRAGDVDVCVGEREKDKGQVAKIQPFYTS